MNDTMPEKRVHEGRNVKRIREIMGIKQDTLAIDLGLSQQSVSLLEQRESIDPELLEKVAKVLKVPVEAIKNFDEAATVNYIANTFNGNSGNYMNFNPLDKVVELYERLLASEREKVELLEKVAGEKKK
jgi:transcriptional regulator with XRE-family HTH domain